MRLARSQSLILGFVLLAVLARGEDQPVCLLTGFQPFGGAKDNPSWEMLKPLTGQTIAGHRIETAELPVVYDEMAKPLADAIAKHQPQVVICFGQGGGLIEIERIARNGYHPAKPPDNKGQRPSREKIEPGGAEQLPTRLPVEAILTALEKARLTAGASEDAGGYLCNECFYRLMATGESAGAKRIVARGFVHVPRVGAPNGAEGTYSLADLTRAVRIVVETTLTAR